MTKAIRPPISERHTDTLRTIHRSAQELSQWGKKANTPRAFAQILNQCEKKTDWLYDFLMEKATQRPSNIQGIITPKLIQNLKQVVTAADEMIESREPSPQVNNSVVRKPLQEGTYSIIGCRNLIAERIKTFVAFQQLP